MDTQDLKRIIADDESLSALFRSPVLSLVARVNPRSPKIRIRMLSLFRNTRPGSTGVKLPLDEGSFRLREGPVERYPLIERHLTYPFHERRVCRFIDRPA